MKLKKTVKVGACAVKIYDNRLDDPQLRMVVKTLCGKTMVARAYAPDMQAARKAAAAQVRWLRKPIYKR